MFPPHSLANHPRDLSGSSNSASQLACNSSSKSPTPIKKHVHPESEKERGPNALTVAQVYCCVEQRLPLLAKDPQIRVHVPGDEHGPPLV
jgi:hypothetical protein